MVGRIVAEFYDADAFCIYAILSISNCCALMLFDAIVGSFCPVWVLLFSMIMLLLWYLMADARYGK